VPIADAEQMLNMDGIWNFLWHVRLLASEQAISALVAIDRNPERLQGVICSRVCLSIDYFSLDARQNGIVMPYFMHPAFTRFKNDCRSMRTEHRLGFASSLGDRAYRDCFPFPIMTRSDVFDALRSRFADQIAVLSTRDAYKSISWHTRRIIIVAGDKPVDIANHILQGRDYLRFLGAHRTCQN
jgi:hypothetical protein